MGFGLPRLALSDYLRLLNIGAITAVTYKADRAPQGSLVFKVNLPKANAFPALEAGKVDDCTAYAETLLMPGSHQHVFDQLAKHQGDRDFRFECAECMGGEDGLSLGLQMLVDATCALAAMGALWYMLSGNSNSTGNFSGKHLETTSSDSAEKPSVTFDDVAGMEETKEELREVISFLQNPQSFYALGARPPRGLLLAGPSGTGKTLLARAVAGEARVPFLYASSAAFVEVFVGQGAQRIRQFFENARSQAPCIVFLDELDAVGAARQMTSSGNQEYCQTLNQLLLELDGVESHSSGSTPLVVTIAATNRYDCLDEALVRPGRLDRIVMVQLPGFRERKATLEIHARKLQTEGLDFDYLAAQTEGKSGADLANLLNEAALLAARQRAEHVRMDHVMTMMRKRRPEQNRSSHAAPGSDSWSDENLLSASQILSGLLSAASMVGGQQPRTSPTTFVEEATNLD